MFYKLLIVLIFYFCFNGNDSKEDFIKWSNEIKIRWSDFHGNLQQNTPVAAVSFVGIVYKTITKSYEFYLLEVYASFDRNKSCVWMEKASDSLLVHEQGHFNLAEIYSRKMRKALIENRSNYYRTKVNEDIHNLFNMYSDSLSIRQNCYDKETHFSQKYDKQIEWNLTIRKELKELERYRTRYVKIYLKNI